MIVIWNKFRKSMLSRTSCPAVSSDSSRTSRSAARQTRDLLHCPVGLSHPITDGNIDAEPEDVGLLDGSADCRVGVSADRRDLQVLCHLARHATTRRCGIDQRLEPARARGVGGRVADLDDQQYPVVLYGGAAGRRRREAPRPSGRRDCRHRAGRRLQEPARTCPSRTGPRQRHMRPRGP